MNIRSITVLLALMGAGMLASGQLYLLLPVAHAVAQHFHSEDVAVTWLGSAFGLAYAAGFLFWGPTSDWMGRRKVLLIGLALSALATLMAAWAPWYGLELIARVLQGLSAASIPPAGLALVSEMLPARWRPIGQGMVSFSFIAAAPIAQLYSHESGLSFSTMMILGAIGFALIAAVLMIALPARSDHGVHRIHPLSHSIQELVANPVILTVWATSFTILFGFVAFQGELNSTLNVAGLDQITIRLFTVLGMLASFGVGLVIQRFGDVRTLRAGLTVICIALTMAALLKLPLQFPIVILSVGVATSIAGVIATISRAATHATRGLAIAVYSFFLFVGASITPVISKAMTSTTLTLIAPAFIIAVAIALLGMPWMHRAPLSSTTPSQGNQPT